MVNWTHQASQPQEFDLVGDVVPTEREVENAQRDHVFHDLRLRQLSNVHPARRHEQQERHHQGLLQTADCDLCYLPQVERVDDHLTILAPRPDLRPYHVVYHEHGWQQGRHFLHHVAALCAETVVEEQRRHEEGAEGTHPSVAEGP